MSDTPKYTRAEREQNIDMRINLALNAITDLLNQIHLDLPDAIYVLEVIKFDLLERNRDKRVYGNGRN